MRPRRRHARRCVAAALILCCVAALASGCGKASTPSAAELALEREDLIFVSHALQALEGQSGAEVAATRAAWPQIAAGLHGGRRGLYTRELADAVEAGERLRLPPLFEERQAAALTGPASGLSGLYRVFASLAGRGWHMIGAAVDGIEHGDRADARFARANSPLYIDAVYDAHFALAQMAKQLVKGYEKLGGEQQFGHTLTAAEVSGLARTYDEERDRLQPHVAVKLGS